MSPSIRILRGLAIAGAISSGIVLPATAADNGAQARYRAEMAVCASGNSNQAPETCREEARRALAAARQGALDDANGSYQQNAAQRCEALQGSERADCQSRMRGMGSVEGSAQGGGILRETVTTTIVPASTVK